MAKFSKIDSADLMQVAMRLMSANGKPLEKLPSRGREQVFGLPDGETVRVRTCNDRRLIVNADEPHVDAKLSIEGTNWLLVVIPEVARTPGPVSAYLVPAGVAVLEVRRSHGAWLESHPRTNGQNKAWKIEFDGKDAPWESFASKWAQYRLPGSVDTQELAAASPTAAVLTSAMPVAPDSQEPTALRMEIDTARHRIAQIAGVSVEAVRVSIDFAS